MNGSLISFYKKYPEFFLLSLCSLFSILVIFLLGFSHSPYPFLLHSCSFLSLVLSLLISLVRSMSYCLSDRHFWHYEFYFFAVVSLQYPLDLVLLQGCKHDLKCMKQKRKPGGENRLKWKDWETKSWFYLFVSF